MISAFRALAGGRRALPEQLTLPAGTFPLRVSRNPRARRLSLRVCAATRSVKLTLPQHVAEESARDFLERHRGWLARQAGKRLPPVVPFAPGVALPVAGSELLLAHGDGRIARKAGQTLLVPGDGPLYAARVRRWLQKEALLLLEQETRGLAGRIGKPVREVRVGDFRSRWGSCSSDGRIAYSWRLLLAPVFVRRAVVAHEVAHLLEPNHGRHFWNVATHLLGQPHDEARHWLNSNAPLLMRYGAG